jgi:mediator of RNA polymerase II transcription subunit 9
MLLSRNADQLSEKLADSYVMRRAAQMVVSVFYRTKAITEENKLDKIVDSDKLKLFVEKFQKNIQEEMQKAKQELESKRK